MNQYCYFVQAGKRGPVKIGLCGNLKHRIAELQTGNAEELKIVFAIKCKSRKMAEAVEWEFHRYFKSRHIRGEWFSRSVIKRFRKMHWYNLGDCELVTELE